MATNLKFTDTKELNTHVTAGKAFFTIENTETGNRVTYKVKHVKDQMFFVSSLTGSDNSKDYTYIGFLINEKYFKHSEKSRITADALSVKVFDWFYNKRISKNVNIEKQVNVVLSDNCLRCGRKLTVPASVNNGYGPECIKHIHGEK